MAVKLSSFERLVFKIVRWFFLGMALLAFLVMIVSAFSLVKALPSVFGPEEPKKIEVTYEEVRPQTKVEKMSVETDEKVTSTEQSGKGQSNVTASGKKTKSKLDFEIDKTVELLKLKLGHMFPLVYHEERLKAGLKNLITKYPENIQNECIRGLQGVINSATQEELMQVEILENYFNTFESKYENERRKLSSKKAKAKNEVIQSAIAIGSSISMIVFAGIFLLLSAIEKNTRIFSEQLNRLIEERIKGKDGDIENNQ